MDTAIRSLPGFGINDSRLRAGISVSLLSTWSAILYVASGSGFLGMASSYLALTDHVEAVACDMNSDFQEAFEEKCPHIQLVFDYFHIVKNFNDKVVSEVRKDEQRRLYAEGSIEAARVLKKTKYILTSSRETLQKKDADAAQERVIHKGSGLFKTEDIIRKP